MYYHRHRCLFRCCIRTQQPPPRALPPAESPTTMTTTRDDRAEVPNRAAARPRERQGAVFCALLLPHALDGGDNDDADWVARGLMSSGDGSLVALTLCWSAALLLLWGEREGGVARRLAEFLAGVRRTKIEDGMHKDKAGCMRLSAGGRKRGAAASVAGTRAGSQGWGASSGVAGDGNSRGPEDRSADAPPVAFWTAMAQMVGIGSRRVIGVISRYHFVY